MATSKKSSKGDDQKYTLDATKREVFGKKLKKLRAQNLIPANIYGPGFTSTSVSVPAKEFSHVFSKARETGIIYITVDGQEIPVLSRQIQRHPLEHNILHVDFRKVDLTQKIETEVPIRIIGEAPAAEKGGVLLTQADHLLVESLPADIPQDIEIDVSILDEIGKEIKVSDLVKDAKYVVKEEPEKVIVSIVAHKEESLEPEVAAPAVEGEEGAAAEGAAPAEGEAPAEGAEAAEGGEKPKEAKEDKGGDKQADKKEAKKE